jgi:hypothetical protein
MYLPFLDNITVAERDARKVTDAYQGVTTATFYRGAYDAGVLTTELVVIARIGGEPAPLYRV